LELLLALPMLQDSHFLLLVHLSCVKSKLLSRLFYHITRGVQESPEGEILNKIQKSKVKNQRSKIKMTIQNAKLKKAYTFPRIFAFCILIFYLLLLGHFAFSILIFDFVGI